MAGEYSHLPGDAHASHNRRNRSQSSISPAVPVPSPPKQRSSSFYPPRGGLDIFDESNADPFYLEESLADSAWDSCNQNARNVRYSEEAQQYYMFPSVNTGKELPHSTRSRHNVDRSTLSVVELEHQLGLQQTAFHHPWELHSIHHSQGSFSSVQTEATPELTPSSSFSSNYSSPMYTEALGKTADQRSLRGRRMHMPPPPSLRNRSHSRPRPPLPNLPPTPTRDATRPPPPRPSTDSSDTLIMPQPDAQDLATLRGKPLPSLPNTWRNGSANRRGPAAASGPKASIEPSMISPPSLINPVTLEPHTSHFDQALFIPANSCPSPVPSPGPSPSIDVERPPATAPAPASASVKGRPSTSTSEFPPSELQRCEQSVWESDSDTESLDPRSLSKKPMDTLKKVRSRVHLRVAKSAPKLQPNQSSQQPGPAAPNQPLEKFPSMPDQQLPRSDLCPPSPTTTAKKAVTQTMRSRGRDALRPAAQQTLRLVAPSTTSLPSRSRKNSASSAKNNNSNNSPPRNNIDIDRSTAAAMQAKSRRRQRSSSPEGGVVAAPAEREKPVTATHCREDHHRSDAKVLHGLALPRQPLYKRFWESLRMLGCHGDITPPRPRKPM